jgi:tripartite-type tricarboxylate transporter receptor subunit TctC
MPQTSHLLRLIASGLIVLLVRDVAAAQDAAAFYRDKTIQLVIGGPKGSDEDIYGQLVGHYLGKHVAGLPAVFVADKPGSGGHVAAGYIYSDAPKDGTAIGAVPPDVITAPLWFGLGKIGHDPTKFIYLGSAASESTNCYVQSETPIKTLRDAFVSEVAMGAKIDGGPTRDGPVLLNAILGTKFRVVSTYPDTSAILTAIENGEVAGACGLAWSSVSTRRPDWLPKGVLRGLLQESVTGSSLATRLGIPLASDFVASADDREVLALAYAQQAFGRPFILPPETPPERTAILRHAFMDTLTDSNLQALAKRAYLAIEPLSGASMEALVAKLYATPPQMVDRVRAALANRPAH